MAASFGEALLTFKDVPADVCVAPPSLLSCGASIQLQAVGGAELNVAVALAQLGVPAKWFSILPAGPLGDRVAKVALEAGVDLSGCIRSDPSAPPVHHEMGTLHVVDDGAGPRPHYERLQSCFCKSVGEASFAWGAALAGLQWFHCTGITPLLGAGPRAAWCAALRHARQQAVRVVCDMNHRPALGEFDELWELIEAHMDCIFLLMLSEDAIVTLAKKYSLLSEGAAISPDLLETLQAQLREKLQVPLLAATYKRPLRDEDHTAPRVPPPKSVRTASRAPPPKNVLMAGGNRRWSVIAHASGVVSTARAPVWHAPVQALGGGDAWAAGFISAAYAAGSPLCPSADELWLGCRRGDLMAALQQATHGDLSNVSQAALLETELRWASTTGEPVNLLAAQGKAEPTQSFDAAEGTQRTSSVLSPARILETISAAGIVPVVSLTSADKAAAVARALLAGGISIIEIMLRTPAAEEAIAAVARQVPEMVIGAGTVLHSAQAERAVAAGAHFIVTAGLNPNVVRWCLGRDILVIPGTATPTEVEAALDLGVSTLKFFPAMAMGGLPTLKAITAPYNSAGVRWMPTGGISQMDVEGFLRLPSVIAVGGSWMVPSDAVYSEDYERISSLAAEAVEVAAKARNKKAS